MLTTSFVGLGAKALDIDRLLTGGFCRTDRLALVVVAGAITAVMDLQAIPPLLMVMAVAGYVTAVIRCFRIHRAIIRSEQSPSGT